MKKKTDKKTKPQEEGFKVVGKVEFKKLRISLPTSVNFIEQVGNKFIFTPVKLKPRPATV